MIPTSVTPRKNEWRNRRPEIQALRKAARGDDAVVLHARADVRERVAADAIDGARPASRLQRPARLRKRFALDDRLRAEALEVFGFLDAARRGGDVETEMRQKENGNAADTATRARHDDLALVGRDALPFQRHDAKHRRVARRAERHRALRAQALRQRNEPVAFEARIFRKAAPVTFADAKPVEHNGIARP